ncbi:MAG: GAF domain-containing sensor histidine kinase [Halobacterium sp.]
MTPDGTLLRAVTRATASADGADAVRREACAAIADTDRSAAVYDDGGVLASAGDADPPTPDAPDDVTTVDDAGETWILTPVAAGETRRATLAVTTLDDEPDADVEDVHEYFRGVGETLGQAVAAAVDEERHRRIEATLADERRQFEKLHSVADQMVACETEDGIYQLAIDAAENILEFDICGIDVAQDGVLVPKALSTGMESGDSEPIPTDEGVAGETYQEQRHIIVADVAGVEDADPTNPDYRSILSVPIGGVGVFQAASEQQDAFTERDAELAEVLMAHVAETLGRVQSEAALRESEAKYRTLIEQSHDAVAIFRDGDSEFVNDRATELFDRNRETLLSMDAWEIVHREDRDDLEAIHEELLAEVGRQRTFESRIRQPDGDVRYCEFSVTSIDYKGDVAALASIRDITERKERERELERQNERLDEFASVVSHDLRSPINVARGSVDLARRSDDDEHLDRAEDALERMEAIVEDVLELARQGRLVDETEPVDLGDVATEAWESVDAPEATLDVADDEDRVEADPGRLRELFENLFRNAVEHGGADVTVTVTTCEEGFAVTDDGPGIPQGAHDEVFDRGFTSAEDGTGFGLAIVENIADAHDWTIEAVPAERADGGAGGDRGARFEVTGVATAK